MSARSQTQAALVLSFQILIGCGTSDVSEEQLNRTHWDGETLFRGVVLMTGPAAEAVPVIRNNLSTALLLKRPEQVERLRNLHERLIAAIRSDNPTYFLEFKASIESNDPILVDRTLRDGAERVVRAAMTLEEGAGILAAAAAGFGRSTREDLKLGAEALRRLQTEATGTNKTVAPNLPPVVHVAYWFVYVVAAIDAALAVNVVAVMDIAVAVNVEAVVNIDYEVNYTRDSGLTAPGGTLSRERMVESVTTTFALQG